MHGRKQRDRQIRIKLLDLQDKHCETCEVKEEFQKKYSQAEFQRKMNQYCLNDCSIGKKMQKLGKKILETRPAVTKPIETIIEEKPKVSREKWLFRVPNSKSKETVNMKKELTKEVYLKERIKGKRNTQIEREYGLSPNSIYPIMKTWGLTAKEVNEIVKNAQEGEKMMVPEIAKPKQEVKEETTTPALSAPTIVEKEPGSFIAATVERDQEILAKAVPKKSGRKLMVDTTDVSLVIEEELRALLGYVEAMPAKQYRLELSLVEVAANE